MRKAIIGAASVLTVGLGGCGPSPDMPMHTQTRNAKEVTVKDNARATVTRIAKKGYKNAPHRFWVGDSRAMLGPCSSASSTG